MLRARLASVARRHASTASHPQEGYTAYEGFATPFWRNVVLVSLAGAAFYELAPAPDKDVYLTRWMAMYQESRERLLDVNAKHTALSQEASETALLLHDAKQPMVRRLRYPQVIEQYSPFNTPPAMVDLRGTAVKGERDDRGC